MITHYTLPTSISNDRIVEYQAQASLHAHPDFQLIVDCASLDAGAYIDAQIGGALTRITRPGKIALGHARSDRPSTIRCAVKVVGRARFSISVVSFARGEDIPGEDILGQ